MSEWQPIETAPKDGTTIVAWGRYNEEPVTVRWERRTNNHGWHPVYDGSRVIASMTDFGTDYRDAEVLDWWQPLPEPPEGTP